MDFQQQKYHHKANKKKLNFKSKKKHGESLVNERSKKREEHEKDLESAFKFDPSDLVLRTFPEHCKQSVLNFFKKEITELDDLFYKNRSQFESELKRANTNNTNSLKHDFQFLFLSNNENNKFNWKN